MSLEVIVSGRERSCIDEHTELSHELSTNKTERGVICFRSVEIIHSIGCIITNINNIVHRLLDFVQDGHGRGQKAILVFPPG